MILDIAPDDKADEYLFFISSPVRLLYNNSGQFFMRTDSRITKIEFYYLNGTIVNKPLASNPLLYRSVREGMFTEIELSKLMHLILSI